MTNKKSKSRFADLVKFVPEEEDNMPVIRSGNSPIMTRPLNVSDYEDNYDDEPYGDEIEYDDIIEPDYDEQDLNHEEYDLNKIVDEIELEEDYELEPQPVSEVIEKTEKTEKKEEKIKEDKPMNTSFAQGPQEIKKQEFKVQAKDVTESIILGNTTIKGDIITDVGIQIYGSVIGNIESGGKVQLIGRVEGDITGKSVIVTNTIQQGNITAENDVVIKEGCTIVGDITAKKVSLKGTVQGDIDASGQVDFEPTSRLEGNVSAATFSIKPGAKINGTIGTK